PVLIDPVARRRIIATDEIIVQFRGGIGGPQAASLFNQQGLEELVGPVPSVRSQYLVRVASGPDKHALNRAEQVAQGQGVEWAEPNFFCELQLYFIPNDTLFTNQQYLHNTG